MLMRACLIQKIGMVLNCLKGRWEHYKIVGKWLEPKGGTLASPLGAGRRNVVEPVAKLPSSLSVSLPFGVSASSIYTSSVLSCSR